MDSPQAESGGGKSLTSKLKAKVPHSRGVKDKVKNLKNRLPGMKKHNSDDDLHEDSSEYDENSPRGPGSVGDPDYDSRPAQISPTGYDSQNRHHDSRPSQNSPTGYDSQNRNYVSAAPPTRPAPLAPDSPRSNLAPTLEEKFKHLGVGEQRPRHGAANSPTEEQFYSPSATETAQKGYSDVPSKSYRSNPASSPATTSTTTTTATPTTPTTPTNKGMLEKVRDTVASATAALGDKMGYYNDHTPSTPRDPNAPSLLNNAKATLGMDKPRDPNAPSILAQAKSTLGVDKPRDPNAPPLTERAKSYMSVASQKTREYSATAADRAGWTKDRVAAQTTPTHHDKALSEQVTESLSNLPGAIREKVFGGRAAASSPSGHSAANPPASPGIVDRVSGAVSSLFTAAAPKDTGDHLQHTFPAHSDDVVRPREGTSAAAPPFADHSSAQEGTPATSTPAYPPVKN